MPPQQISSDSTLSGWTLYPEQVFTFAYAGGSYLAPHHHVNSDQEHQPEVCMSFACDICLADTLLPLLRSRYSTDNAQMTIMCPYKPRLPNTRTSHLPTRPFRTGRRHRYQPQILCRRRLRWNPLITYPPSGIMATTICPRLNPFITRHLLTKFSQFPMVILLSPIVGQAIPTYRLCPPSRRQAQQQLSPHLLRFRPLPLTRVEVGMTSLHRTRWRTLSCAR